jgi:putative membrane protein
MFINYIPLMLINIVTGFVLLVTFVYSGLDLDGKYQKRWIPGFGMVGAIALIAQQVLTLKLSHKDNNSD